MSAIRQPAARGFIARKGAAIPSGPNGKTTLASTGLGVEGMRVRTELVGGELEIQPAYPYTVITRLPIARKADMI